jgi:hypothetical protein
VDSNYDRALFRIFANLLKHEKSNLQIECVNLQCTAKCKSKFKGDLLPEDINILVCSRRQVTVYACFFRRIYICEEVFSFMRLKKSTH